MHYISVYKDEFDYSNGDVSYVTTCHTKPCMQAIVLHTTCGGAVVEIVDGDEYTGVCQVYSNKFVTERGISKSEWDDIVNG